MDTTTTESDLTLVLEETGRLEPYVPRVLAEWDLDTGGRAWQQLDATLVFADISGFTNLSERLATRGRIGAEELTDVLDRVFGSMLQLAYQRGGSLLKFGGDALLLSFEGPDHPVQAASAAVEMRAALREATTIPTSVGKIPLRMSVGIHSGLFDLFRVGTLHRELIITGAAATETTEMEKVAEAGEIVVSAATRDALPRGSAPAEKGRGFLLRWRQPADRPAGLVERRPVPASVFADSVPVALRPILSVGQAESEHRLATVAFLKYKGVDAAMADGGHERVAECLHELVTIVQEAANEENVAFLASDIDEDGGKVILTGGVPVTQEDDEGRVLRAARAIIEAGPPFPTRLGVNRGHVFSGEVGIAVRRTYTVMGDTVNLAARLMAAASPGQVYATPAVLDRSRTLFATTALEPFMVKGKSAPIQAYAVGEATGVRTVERKGSLPFRGRETEAARLQAALENLLEGSGGSLTVVGETGVGKSRLVEEAVDAVDAPLQRFSVMAEPNGETNPYWAFRDPLRRLLDIDRHEQERMSEALRERIEHAHPSLLPWLPLIGDVAHIEIPDNEDTAAIEPRFRPERTADAVVGLVQELLPGNLVVLAEDVHWLDEASMALLRRLASAAETRPWLVLLTSRPASGVDPIGEVLELGPIADDVARGLAITATEAAPLRPHELDAVVGRAGGNPLFLEEILRLVRETGGAEALPESLDAVVGSEIDRLPPLTGRLLRYSSVLGRSFRRVVLDEFLAPEQVELDAATRRSLSRFIEADGPDRWRFRHAVMHDVAYEGLSYRRRRELHARAGEVIERLAGDEPESVAEFLATHYSIAGSYEKAWHYSRVAGDKARSAYANIEASRHYERALEAARRVGVDGRQRGSVWEQLGDVLQTAGLFEAAYDAYAHATALLETEPVTRAELYLKRARARERTRAYRSALQQTSAGRRVLRGIESDEARLADTKLLAFRALIHQAQEKPRMARQLALEIIESHEAERHLEPLAQAHTVLGWACRVLGASDATDHDLKALELWEKVGDRDAEARATGNIGYDLYFEGRWDQAVRFYERSRELSMEVGNLVQAALMGANTGEILVNQGHLDEGEFLLRESVRVLRSSGYEEGRVFAETQLGRLLALKGQLDEAESLLSDVRRGMVDQGLTGAALEASLHLADVLLRREEPGKALELLEEAADAAGEEAMLFTASLSRLRALAHLFLGDVELAESEIRRGLETAREQELPYEEALLLTVLHELQPQEETNEKAARLMSELGIVSTHLPGRLAALSVT